MKTVFISGNFNIIHPGHLRLLKFAKEIGDKLIVGVLSDEIAKDGAFLSEELRLESISSINFVDQAFIIKDSISNILQKLKPDIVLKGNEHENKHNEESRIVQKYGGTLLFSSGNNNFISTDLFKKDFVVNYTRIQNRNVLDYVERHDIKQSTLNNYIKNFSKLKIIVIGDLIVDEYINCDPLGMSREDPTIVVTPIDSKKFIGGAGIVAAHAASLGAKVNFISVVGNDETFDFAKNKLTEYNVNNNLIQDATRPTTLKIRYRCSNKTLLRVSYLQQRSISLNIQNKIIKIFNEVIKNSNLIIFSDFSYGCLPRKLINKLSKIATSQNVLMVADSQTSSQNGDISKFKKMSLITPTEHEARSSLRNSEDGLVVLAEKLCKNNNVNNILLKLGSEGLFIHQRFNESHWLNDLLPALNDNPIDVSGAGDSLLTASSMIIASGGSIWEAALVGNIAASIQISRIGNMPLSSTDLTKELKF